MANRIGRHTQQVSDFEGEGCHVQKLRSVAGVWPLHCALGHGAIAVVKASAEAGAASHWLVTIKVKGKPGAPRKHRLVVSKPLPQDLPKRCAPTYSDDDHRGTGLVSRQWARDSQISGKGIAGAWAAGGGAGWRDHRSMERQGALGESDAAKVHDEGRVAANRRPQPLLSPGAQVWRRWARRLQEW